MLPCPKCGYDNELGRIFCHQCGQKLDLSAIKPPTAAEKRKRRLVEAAVRWTRRAVKLMILALVLCALWLMLQELPEPAQPSEQEVMAAREKWAAVQKLIGGTEAGSVEASVAEVNAFVANLRAGNPDQNWGFLAERVWLGVRDGRMEWKMRLRLRLVGALERTVGITLEGIPKLSNGTLGFEVTGGAVGRLRLPAAMVRAIGLHNRIFAEALGQVLQGKETISQLHRIEIRPDRVVAYYQPR